MVNKERLVKKFLKLLSFNSPSGEEEQISKHCTKELKRLGLFVYVDKHSNILARRKGVGKPIILTAHIDTVLPTLGQKVTFNQGVFKTDGKTILGSDNKAGVAIIFETLEIVKEYGLKIPPLEIVFTVKEEIGLIGSSLLDYKKLRSKMGLALDLGGFPGRCAIRSIAHIKLDVDFIGKAAHSAVSGEGVNALLMASEALSSVKLGDLDKSSCVNFGIVSGGTASNIVPAQVSLKGEIRSPNYKRAEQHIKKIISVFRKVAKKYGGRVFISKKLDFKGYSFLRKDEVIRRFKKACSISDLEFFPSPSKGGSDANIFNSHGIKVLNISIGNLNAHSGREEIHIVSMLRATRLVVDFLEVN